MLNTGRTMYIIRNKMQSLENTKGSGRCFMSISEALDYMTLNKIRLENINIWEVQTTSGEKLVIEDHNIDTWACDFIVRKSLDRNEILLSETGQKLRLLYNLKMVLSNPKMIHCSYEDLRDSVELLIYRAIASESPMVLYTFYNKINRFIQQQGLILREGSVSKLLDRCKNELIKLDKDNDYRMEFIIKEKNDNKRKEYIDHFIKDDIISTDGMNSAYLAGIIENNTDRTIIIDELIKFKKYKAISKLCNEFATEKSVINQVFKVLYQAITVYDEVYLIPTLGNFIKFNGLEIPIEDIADTIIKISYKYEKSIPSSVVEFISQILLSSAILFHRLQIIEPKLKGRMIMTLVICDNDCIHSADLIGTDNINKKEAEILLGHVLAKSKNPQLEIKALRRMKKYN